MRPKPGNLIPYVSLGFFLFLIFQSKTKVAFYKLRMVVPPVMSPTPVVGDGVRRGTVSQTSPDTPARWPFRRSLIRKSHTLMKIRFLT